MRIKFHTLGCKVNQNETAALAALLQAEGHVIVGEEESAQVCILNSCTVTAASDAKGRRWLARARRENPGAVIVLTGCLPQAADPATLPQADIITGTAGRLRLPAHLRHFLQTGQRVLDVLPLNADTAFEELAPPAGPTDAETVVAERPQSRQPAPANAEEPGENSFFFEKHEAYGKPVPRRTRAFVKIQDGCNRRCSYCIVPQARGPSRSRAQASILAELARLAQAGHQEVVLTGVNLPSYGRERGESLADIVEQAAQVKGIQRIRLSSLDPDLVDERTAARLAATHKLCPHFHLSLQSGCAATLRRMRRPYTPEKYRRVVATLRQLLPQASFTTDVIVGFPGETEADFMESLAFVEEMQFLKVHVFPYSVRPGTEAAALEGQLSKKEKAARAAQMQHTANMARGAVLAAQQGSQHEVLLEAPLPDGRFTGYTGSYIPVVLRAAGFSAGRIVAVQLGAFDGQRCKAVLL